MADWSEQHVRRLFWRAGFGATAEEAGVWAQRGRRATLDHVVDGPVEGRKLRGPAPRVDRRGLDPVNEWGDDVLWWLDQMLRTNYPLVERMTLFWHDHFATSDQDAPLMLRQNRMLRGHALGSFPALLRDVTHDPAMQLFLSLADSSKGAPNENYARELMELFTLGSGYGERDIRETARALTGFRSNWKDGRFGGIAFDREQHDGGVKRIFGRAGRFGVDDVIALVCDHPRHAPFLVAKLWSYFIAEPPSRETVRGLAATYRRSGLSIKPVVRAILEHPMLYRRLDAPDMVKWPVVYVAGAMRASRTFVTAGYPTWLLASMGQQLFHPPSVAGWDWGAAWLSSNSMKQRFTFGNHLIENGPAKVEKGSVKVTIGARGHYALAHAAVGSPQVSTHTREVLTHLAAGWFHDIPASWRAKAGWRAESLQRTLRHLLLTCPESQLC
ncbi:MAG: hypothetical protein JWQ48_3448 [Conexibacter sp.]|nr:hypothetical protein [Conexibacter sp.]